MDGRRIPDRSPLHGVYQDWARRFKETMMRGWRRKQERLVARLRAQYPNKAGVFAAKSHTSIPPDVGMGEEFWDDWKQGYVDDFYPFMEEAVRIAVDMAAADVNARFAISVEPGAGLNADIAEFAHDQTMRLVSRNSRMFRRTLTENDIMNLRKALSDWVERGGTFPELVDAINDIVVNERRAEMIAATEATRAFAVGQRTYWEHTGVVNASKWNTANDELVCPICGPLDNKVVPLEENFSDEFDIYEPPAHINCRCWPTPAVLRDDDSAPIEGDAGDEGE